MWDQTIFWSYNLRSLLQGIDQLPDPPPPPLYPVVDHQGDNS